MRAMLGWIMVAAVAPVLWALEKPPRLKQLLTPAEFEATGLHKLTGAELAALEAALHRRALGRAAAAAAAAAATTPDGPERTHADFGAEMLPAERRPAAPDSVRTRIVGSFAGWDGKTIFRLENGQRWQQRMPGRFFLPHPLQNPEVVLERGPFGYRLLVVAAGQHVPVKRVE